MSAPLSSFYRQRQKWPHCQFLLHVVKHDPKRYPKFRWWLPREHVCNQSNDSRNSATHYRFGTNRTLRGESSTFSMKSGDSAKITELNCAEMDFQIAAEKPSSHDATCGLCIAVFHEPNTRYHTLTLPRHTPRAMKKSGMAFPPVYCQAEFRSHVKSCRVLQCTYENVKSSLSMPWRYRGGGR